MIDLGSDAVRPARWARSARRVVLRHRRALAALCAGLAVLAALTALRSPAAPGERVVVAAHDLPAGARLTADDVTTVAWPASAVPEGVDVDPVGRLLAAPLRRGEPVTDVRLVGPALTTPDTTALPVRLPDAATAALLRVGDHVDLLAADPQGGPARLLVDDVAVLATPDDATPSGADAAALPGRVVVMGVPTAAVADVAQASVSEFVTYDWSAR